MEHSPASVETICARRRRSRRPLGLASLLSSLPARLAAGALIGLAAAAGAAAEASKCGAMLGHAPESIRRLEAVQACRGADAGCSYMEASAGYGVLTLICPRSGVAQVLAANRLTALGIQDGALAGDCSSGAWRHDLGLPGCYTSPGFPAGGH